MQHGRRETTALGIPARGHEARSQPVVYDLIPLLAAQAFDSAVLLLYHDTRPTVQTEKSDKRFTDRRIYASHSVPRRPSMIARKALAASSFERVRSSASAIVLPILGQCGDL